MLLSKRLAQTGATLVMLAVAIAICPPRTQAFEAGPSDAKPSPKRSPWPLGTRQTTSELSRYSQHPAPPKKKPVKKTPPT